MVKLIEGFRVERLYPGTIEIMCKCSSYDIARKAIMSYASGDDIGAMYHITKYFRVVNDEE